MGKVFSICSNNDFFGTLLRTFTSGNGLPSANRQSISPTSSTAKIAISIILAGPHKFVFSENSHSQDCKHIISWNKHGTMQCLVDSKFCKKEVRWKGLNVEDPTRMNHGLSASPALAFSLHVSWERQPYRRYAGYTYTGVLSSHPHPYSLYSRTNTRAVYTNFFLCVLAE